MVRRHPAPAGLAKADPEGTVLIRVVVAVAVLSAVSCSTSGWRSVQADAVRSAVLRELVAGAHSDARPVCVCVFRGKSLLGEGSCEDPSPALLRDLATLAHVVQPFSQCADAQDVLTVAVGEIDWINDEFVKVEGSRSGGPLCPTGFAHSLSFRARQWSVDTATLVWIA